MQALASVELYDPRMNKWTSGPPMRTARFFAAQTTLSDGRVLVAGGHTGTVALDTAELFDPQTRCWVDVASLYQHRHSHSMSAITDGRAVVCGGESMTKGELLKTTETYDPTSDTWVPTAPLTDARRGCSSATLREGAVLVCCGYGGTNGPLASVELLRKTDLIALDTDGTTILPPPPPVDTVPSRGHAAALRGWLAAAETTLTKTQHRIEVAQSMIHERRDAIVAAARLRFDAAVRSLDQELDDDIAAADAERDERLSQTGTHVLDAAAVEVFKVRRFSEDPRRAFSLLTTCDPLRSVSCSAVDANALDTEARRLSAPAEVRTQAGDPEGRSVSTAGAWDVVASPPRRRTRPENHYCAITSQVLFDPVNISCGDTFERSAIEEWFKASACCPTCGSVADKTVSPDAHAKAAIREWAPVPVARCSSTS
jgi:hypothetical protein